MNWCRAPWPDPCTFPMAPSVSSCFRHTDRWLPGYPSLPMSRHLERGELRVAVSYSGDLESAGPRVYEYIFDTQ